MTIISKSVMDAGVNIPDEEYVIQRAKKALKDDQVSAKAWMITAKTLYPSNFGVQFEAYRIEKCAGHVKEAAKCFSDLIDKFHQQPEFWSEINRVTSALRVECDSADTEKQFLCEMFKHMTPDIQHKLLLLTADHCDDTMEHCKLVLLLLQRFPNAIPNHAPGLIDTLLSAEKHSHSSNQPVNCYRKVLVCDLLPLLNEENVPIELTSKLLYKLLHKAIGYHLYSLNAQSSSTQDINSTEQPWNRLCNILEYTSKQLGWNPYLTSFGANWSKESYWQKLWTFCQSQMLNLDDYNNTKQLIYCLTIFFLHCLHEYKLSLAPESSPGQPQTTYILIEAFNDPNLLSPVSEPKIKRRKGDQDNVTPHLTVEKPELKHVINNFMMAVKCWELINSADALKREFGKLNTHLKLDTWLGNFLIDYAVYKGQIDDAFARINQGHEPFASISKNLRCASILYLKKNYIGCYEQILSVISLLPPSNIGALSNCLVSSGMQRHLHYLPLTQQSVLQFCTKLLIRATSENADATSYSDSVIGNIFVLCQLDWPQEEDRLPPLLNQLQQRGVFHYYLFQSYVVNVDILEELTYLWTHHTSLDVVPHLGQRRIGTRGSDKGVKEEVKQAIRRQVARSNEPLDQLIITFITQERGHISQTLI